MSAKIVKDEAGVEFGVTDDGTPFLSQRGLEKFTGIPMVEDSAPGIPQYQQDIQKYSDQQAERIVWKFAASMANAMMTLNFSTALANKWSAFALGLDASSMPALKATLKREGIPWRSVQEWERLIGEGVTEDDLNLDNTCPALRRYTVTTVNRILGKV